MSGGHFDYSQYRLEDIASEIDRYIKNNEYGYSLETLNEFKVAARKLREAAIYAQRIDWLLSGDDGEDTFHQRLIEDLGKATQ